MLIATIYVKKTTRITKRNQHKPLRTSTTPSLEGFKANSPVTVSTHSDSIVTILPFADIPFLVYMP